MHPHGLSVCLSLCPLCFPLCLRLCPRSDVRRDRERVSHRTPQRKAAPTSNPPTSSSSSTSSSLAHAGLKDGTNGVHSPLPPDIPRTTAQEIVSASKAQALPSPSTTHPPDDSGAVYGSSYTNRRSREFDLLHDIVKQTRNAFIDVGVKAAGGGIDEEDLAERSMLYTRQLQLMGSGAGEVAAPTGGIGAAAGMAGVVLGGSTLAGGGMGVPSMFALPTAGSGGVSVEDVVRSGGVTVSEREWLNAVAKQVTAAVDSVRLRDTGKLVLSFEEL